MSKPNIFELHLDTVGNPDDLWDQFFFACIKAMGEMAVVTRERVTANEKAVEAIEAAIAEASPELSEKLQPAMAEIREMRKIYSEQSKRSMDHAEEIAVIAQKIAARRGAV